MGLATRAGGLVWSRASMGMGGSRSITRHQREVLRIDRRWLVTWIVSFCGSLLLFSGAYAVYKATGPHPEMTVFLRAVRHEVRWLIPGLKRKPNAKDQGVRLETDDLRHVAVETPHGRIGHTAQRASASGRRGAMHPASRSRRYAVQSGRPITLQ